MSSVLYICDKHACRKCCSNTGTNACKHTTNINHAVHKNKVYSYFDIVSDGNRTALVELSRKDFIKKYENTISV